MSASGWVGVDLDGTLAHYEGWRNGAIGQPIPAMAERVRKWLSDGVEVRVFTARASEWERLKMLSDSDAPGSAKQRYQILEAEAYQWDIKPIEDWTEKHFGQRLRVTCMKDFKMIELWDDRAVAVEINTGEYARHSKLGWQLPIGPTGEHPKGKLRDDDMGGLKIAIGTLEDCVFIQFGTPVEYVAFDAPNAIAIAETITARAEKLLGQTG